MFSRNGSKPNDERAADSRQRGGDGLYDLKLRVAHATQLLARIISRSAAGLHCEGRPLEQVTRPDIYAADEGQDDKQG